MHLVIKRVYLFLIPLFSPQTHEAQAALIVTAQQGSGCGAELGVSGYACVCMCTGGWKDVSVFINWGSQGCGGD